MDSVYEGIVNLYRGTYPQAFDEALLTAETIFCSCLRVVDAIGSVTHHNLHDLDVKLFEVPRFKPQEGVAMFAVGVYGAGHLECSAVTHTGNSYRRARGRGVLEVEHNPALLDGVHRIPPER
jgi:hypothetical protein